MTIQLRLMGTYFFGKSIMNTCCNKWRNWLRNTTVHETHLRFCKRHQFDKLRAGSISWRKKLHNSHILKTLEPFMLDVLEIGRGQTGRFLKLIGEMGHAAIMELIGNFGERKPVIDHQFFHPFDLMFDNEVLDGRTLDFGKQIGKIRVIMI